MPTVSEQDGSPTAQLVRSACSSNPREARRLLAEDPRLAQGGLAAACVCGEAEAVARLLAASPGALNEPVGPLARAPILYACFSRLGRGDPERAEAIRGTLRVLLEAGADADARFRQGDWVQSSLYGAAGIAGDAELTAMLLAAGADPDDRSAEHSVGEALYHACEHPDPSCARLLIDGGTDPDTVTYCLGRALNFPNPAMVRMFCEHGARAEGEHLVQAVLRRRGTETVELLLGAGAPADGAAGSSALGLAVRWGEEPLAELLRRHGAREDRVTASDHAIGERLRDDAPTHAPLRGAPPDELARALAELLEVAVDQGDLAIVRRLLDAGAPPEGRPIGPGEDPEERIPPLQSAAWRGHADIAAELVRRGAATELPGGGSAVGAVLHGMHHCHHPEGGPTMATIDEIDGRRYRDTLRALLTLGARVPARFDDGEGGCLEALLAELGVQAP